MDKTALIAVLLATIIAVAAFAAYTALSQPPASQTPRQYTYRIIETYPHDAAAYTEGLVYVDGALYESTGEVGTSSLRRVNLQSGTVLQSINLTGDLYGEGLAAVNDTLVQLTWQNHVAFIFDKASFQTVGNFTVDTQGWGLTYDGANLILSDGTDKLYHYDPVSHSVVGEVTVMDGDQPVYNINELEYVGGDIYANIWKTTQVAIINPQNGQVKGWVDLSGLHQPLGMDDVLNGIAYDAASGRLFVTGKNWPSLYQIEIVPKT